MSIKIYRLASNVLSLIFLSLITGSLFYIGNIIIPYIYDIPVGQNYLYNVSYSKCLLMAAVTCTFAYVSYGVALVFIKLKIGMKTRIAIAIGCYFILLFIYAGQWGQMNIFQPFIVKNIIVYVCAGMLTPFLENFFIRKINPKSFS